MSFAASFLSLYLLSDGVWFANLFITMVSSVIDALQWNYDQITVLSLICYLLILLNSLLVVLVVEMFSAITRVGTQVYFTCDLHQLFKLFALLPSFSYPMISVVTGSEIR